MNPSYSYKTETTGYLIILTYLLKYDVSAFTNTRSDYTHTLFGIISFGVDAVLCHAQDIV